MRTHKCDRLRCRGAGRRKQINKAHSHIVSPSHTTHMGKNTHRKSRRRRRQTQTIHWNNQKNAIFYYSIKSHTLGRRAINDTIEIHHLMGRTRANAEKWQAWWWYLAHTAHTHTFEQFECTIWEASINIPFRLLWMCNNSNEKDENVGVFARILVRNKIKLKFIIRT